MRKFVSTLTTVPMYGQLKQPIVYAGYFTGSGTNPPAWAQECENWGRECVVDWFSYVVVPPAAESAA